MTEHELVMCRIKHLRWRPYLRACGKIENKIIFCLLYGLFLRLASTLGFDVQRGDAIFEYHIHRLEDLFDEWSALIAEAERAGGASE
jgi:hypothetical protein